MSRLLQKSHLLRTIAAPSPRTASFATKKFSTSNTNRSNSEEEWLHKLDYVQEIFNYGHRVGTRFNVPTYTLHSRNPLLHDDVYKALEEIVKRNMIFKIVVREKDGELWWNKQDNVKIDFKMYKQGPSIIDIMDQLWHEGFDEVNGPLWKTRLLECNEEDKYVTPEIKKKYPHRYNFFSCPHHGLVDGLSSALFSQPLFDTINSVIGGEPLENIRPMGVFVPNDEYVIADGMLKEKLSKDPKRLEAMKQAVIKSTKAPTLLDYYPRPKVDKAESKHVFVDIEPNIINKFLENFKKNGLTYGTSLQTVTNTAYTEMLQEAGATDEAFDISVNMAIDSRRYLKKRSLPALGMHAKQMASMASMQKNPREKFWDNCNAVHNINKELLRSGSAIEQEVIRQHFLPRIPTADCFKPTPPLTRDYGFNNVGSLDPVIHGHGKHVQCTHIVSYQAVHDYFYPFYQQLFTYRANDINMISYDSACVSEDTMNQIIDRVKSIIKQFSN